jgi:hypothetical protein
MGAGRKAAKSINEYLVGPKPNVEVVQVSVHS